MAKSKGITTEDYDKFFELLIGSQFNVKQACTKFGVDHSWYYYKINSDKDFRAKSQAIKLLLADAFMEGALSSNLEVRQKYLSLISSNRLEKIVFGEADDESNTPFSKATIVIE